MIEIAVPTLILLALSAFCLKMAWDVSRQDPNEYEKLRRRAKSMKDVAIGNVDPYDENDMSGGMASKTLPDGRIIITRSRSVTKEDIDRLG